MTTDAIRGLEAHPADNPARAEFMRLLDEHEELLGALLAYRLGDVESDSPKRARELEAFRMSRRQIVAAYDRACLVTTQAKQ